MSTANPVAPCDFVVFGGTGDLAVRKLLPALYLRDRDGQLPAETRIIAASRAGLDDCRLPRQSARRAGPLCRRRRPRRRRPSIDSWLGWTTRASISPTRMAGIR